MTCTTITLVERDEDVCAIVSALHAAGFATDTISVIFPRSPDDTGDAIPPDVVAANAESGQGAALGVVVGGVSGGATVWLAGAGFIHVAALVPLLTASPFLAIFTGMGLGAALGGIAGALLGRRVSQVDARRFASSISDGRTVITVRNEDMKLAHLAEEIMRHSHGQEIAHFDWPGADVQDSLAARA